MKMNRKWMRVAALLLSVAMATTGTLAYLQDTDDAVNVMTVGNVDIEQNEYQWNAGKTALEPFVDNKLAMPEEFFNIYHEKISLSGLSSYGDLGLLSEGAGGDLTSALDAPEKLALQKGANVIVYIEEFQNVLHFDDPDTFLKKRATMNLFGKMKTLRLNYTNA